MLFSKKKTGVLCLLAILEAPRFFFFKKKEVHKGCTVFSARRATISHLRPFYSLNRNYQKPKMGLWPGLKWRSRKSPPTPRMLIPPATRQ
jgi:hypothetical protein